MRVWLVTIGEMLPVKAKARKHRTAMLADALQIEGHEVFWWTSAFDHFSKSWFFHQDTLLNINEGYKIFALKGTGYKKNISLHRFIDHRIIAWKFKKYAPKMPLPNVIVAASPSYDLAYQAVVFAKKNNIPVIVDIRDEWPELFLDYFPRKIRPIAKLFLWNEFKMFKEAVRRADALVAMMERLLDYGLKYAGRQRCPLDRVFYLGAPKNVVRDEVSPKLSFIDDLKGKFVVTFVGTFVKHNDPSIIIDVAEELREEEIYFVLAGDGELFGKLKEQAANLPKVFMPGWLNEDEISFLLSRSSVGIAPTPKLREAFPNKIFAYLSAGLPIISAHQGELRNIIETYELGFYYPPLDKNGLAKCVLELYYNSELYRKCSQNVREIFNKMFDAEKIYFDYAQYIKEIVERHGDDE